VREREGAAHGGAKASCLQIIMQEILLHATSGKLTGRCSGTFTLNFNLESAFGLELYIMDQVALKHLHFKTHFYMSTCKLNFCFSRKTKISQKGIY
jgi:hypothetical protein